MDNDVTPVYLAAQVSDTQMYSKQMFDIFFKEGHLDVLKFLVEAGGSLYVRWNIY